MQQKYISTRKWSLVVVRNAGNIVPHSQHFRDEQNTNEPAALELGCVVNDVRHIIVCGHSDCKAINLLYKLRDEEFSSQVINHPSIYSLADYKLYRKIADCLR